MRSLLQVSGVRDMRKIWSEGKFVLSNVISNQWDNFTQQIINALRTYTNWYIE